MKKPITRRDFHRMAAAMLGAGTALPVRPQARAASRVLLITGQNNHDWKRTTSHVKRILADSGLFNVTLSLTPSRMASPETWNTYRPNFKDYDLVLSNYNGQMWPEPVQADFEAYIRDGGRALMLHAANNPFRGWTAYEQMVGLLWRRKDDGARVYYDDSGTLVRVPAGEGINAGHGVKHEWRIRTRDAEHPIMRGVPEVWMHAYDELYHGQRGPAENMHILASAYSDPEQRGTGVHEPMIWWIPYGEGRVLTFLPGHLWDDMEDLSVFHCVGFRTLLNRSCEWLARDEVTLPIPPDFPGPDTVSLVSA